MKINSDELYHMIDLIDEEFLEESSQRYKIQSMAGMRRVILTAVCIFIFLFATVGISGYKWLMKELNQGNNNVAANISETIMYKINIENKDIWEAFSIIEEDLKIKYSEILIEDFSIIMDSDKYYIEKGNFILNAKEKTIIANIKDGIFYYYERKNSEDESSIKTDFSWAMLNMLFPSKENISQYYINSKDTSIQVDFIIEPNVDEYENCSYLAVFDEVVELFPYGSPKVKDTQYMYGIYFHNYTTESSTLETERENLLRLITSEEL